MAQLTLYVQDHLLKQIEAEAKKEKSSISSWVNKRLTMVLNRSWPADFLALAGSLKDSDIKRPKQIVDVKDARKVSL